MDLYTLYIRVREDGRKKKREERERGNYRVAETYGREGGEEVERGIIDVTRLLVSLRGIVTLVNYALAVVGVRLYGSDMSSSRRCAHAATPPGLFSFRPDGGDFSRTVSGWKHRTDSIQINSTGNKNDFRVLDECMDKLWYVTGFSIS